MSEARLYCRFCAEEKPCTEFSALQDELKSLVDKLSNFGVYLVDFSNTMLPETVCKPCYQLLSSTYEFFAKVERSQVVLSELLYVMHIKTEVKEETIDDKECSEDVKPNNFGDVGVHIELYTENDNYEGGSQIEVLIAATDEQVDPLPITKDIPEPTQITNKPTKTPEVTTKSTQNTNKPTNSPEVKTKTNKSTQNRNKPNSPEVQKNQTKSDYTIQTWADYPAFCKFCDSKMAQQKDLTKHCIKLHRRCFGNKCVDCDLDVTCFNDFVEHVKTHHPNLNEICQYCNINITDLDSDHVSDHTKVRLSCSSCGKVYKKIRDMRVHLSKIEPPQYILPLKKRPKGHKPEANSTCDICGAVMKTPTSVRAHLLTHTDRKRDHTCDRCGKAFFTSSSLKTHRKIHDTTYKEVCRICHKRFLTITRLKKHVKTHNLEMEFQCDHCKRFFNSKDRLREHVRVHMDFKPYQCKYCSKRFKFCNIMKTHENLHTGERPFSCNLCRKDFANWSNCNKHMKRKHGTSLAKTVKTPHGKIAIDPVTGLPETLKIDDESKRWTEDLLKN